jgi:hypothetical protein
MVQIRAHSRRLYFRTSLLELGLPENGEHYDAAG